MQVKYDKKSDSKYIRIKKGKIARTKKELDWLLFDLSKTGDVLGIEILDASLNLVSITTALDELIGCTIVESKSSKLIEEANTKTNENSWELNIKLPKFDSNKLFASA